MATAAIVDLLGLADFRMAPKDWSFVENPFWTTFLLTLIAYPSLFYLTWYLNPSLTKNRLGLSWVLGFYSALLFTIAGIYEVPHLRTIFNSAVDFHSDFSLSSPSAIPAAALSMAVAGMCLPVLKTGVLTSPMASLPSFLTLDPTVSAKYYCFSDLDWKGCTLTLTTPSSTSSPSLSLATVMAATTDAGKSLVYYDCSGSSGEILLRQPPLPGVTSGLDTQSTRRGVLNNDPNRHHNNINDNNLSAASSSSSPSRHNADNKKSQPQGQRMIVSRDPDHERPLSLRHRLFQAQMKRPHLAFSLENYPEDSRIGPQIIAANFQAFLLLDLLMGAIYYRKQLEPFSTVVHHIIYYFIVVHMRKGDMLSVFCILGTPIEASSIFLAFGRMFPHRRTPTVERLYLFSFLTTRIGYVSLLWHEVFFNYPDKSVAFLYTITLSLHFYWFAMYLQTQRRYRAKQRRAQLCNPSEAEAATTVQKGLLNATPQIQGQGQNKAMISELTLELKEAQRRYRNDDSERQLSPADPNQDSLEQLMQGQQWPSSRRNSSSRAEII